MQSRDIAQNVLVSLSSSFQTSPAFWLDPKNGVVNTASLCRSHSIVWTPIGAPEHSDRRKLPGRRASNTWESCTNTHNGTAGRISHYTTQPMINVYAAVDGRDLGGVADDVEKRVQAIAKDLPKGSHIVTRGQVNHEEFVHGTSALELLGAIVLAYLLILS